MIRHATHDRLKRSAKTLIVALLCALMFGVRLLGQCMKDAQDCSKSASSKPPSAFIGCYQLTLGRWWPWSFGDDIKYVTPPSRIRLLTDPGTKGFDQGGYLLRPIPKKEETSAESRESSYWQVRSTNQIDLIWTDGFTGV